MTLYPALPLILVAAGLVLLAVVAYLARLVRRHRRSLGKLLKLAKTSLDPLQLPTAAWPALYDGGLTRIEYSGDWFGQPVQGNLGAAHHGSRPFTFKVVSNNDVRLDFRLYARTDRGEARLFAENLAGVFHLLLETAVHSKMEALSAALAEQAKLTLYLQHDLRNLAQWVEWLAADFAADTDDATLLGIARRLRASAPHAAARAKHILGATCKNHSAPSPVPQVVSLAEAIRQAAEHAGISVTLDQDARVFLRRDLLDRTLDNLFTNVAPLLRLHAGMSIRVDIECDANKVSARINMPRLEEIAQLPPENLFEPFASGRPGGLGLGLYQAHKSVREAGGELTAELHESTICFLLTLPGAKV
ncbi:MAG: hypothetical protein NTY60_03810 [Proteobacteria bacterium]|nr:hypothetical protein [Pseudomonadota bacterium]